MAPHESPPELLALHGVRLQGMASVADVAARFRLDPEVAGELLLDFESYGWVRHDEFAGTSGWSLTDAGRVEDERRLAAELEVCGAAAVVTAVHARFVPLNARFQSAVTRWQIRPLPGDELAQNDHTDHRWDDRVIEALDSLGRRLGALTGELEAVLSRFSGYAERYAAAMTRVHRGQQRWVDGVGLDSCHTVWFQLHEDLLATLGRQRGEE